MLISHINAQASTMKKHKILFIYSQGGKIITGGQVYEDMLFQGLKANPNLEVDRIWLNNIAGKWNKYTSGIRNLQLILKVSKYDLVFFNSVQGISFLPLVLLLRLFAKTKTAVIHHHFLHHQTEGARRTFYKMQEMSFMRSADIIVVPSPYILDLCKSIFPKKEIRYWQIPFDKPTRLTHPVPAPGELLYIGTIEQRKGIAYALDALASLQKRGLQCHLTIVGKTVEQEYRATLDKTIADRGLNVTFTGFISADEKQRLMDKADAFLFPSLLEGYGMVLCEAMMNGLPVVCFNNSAMPYTIKDGYNGILAPNRNAEAMATAIERITTDRILRRQLSQGALAFTASLHTTDSFHRTANREVQEIIGG